MVLGWCSLKPEDGTVLVALQDSEHQCRNAMQAVLHRELHKSLGFFVCVLLKGKIRHRYVQYSK